MVRVRKLVLAIAAASALTSGMAHALGLGEISLKSSLNQPLDAEIELLEVRDLGNGEVLPSLAAVEEFNKVGVDRPYFLTDLKFTPVLKPNGRSVIRVTSSKPVREPYLNFLVEVLWPNGRLLREYTVLLDPPLYSPQTVVAATPRLPQTVPVAPRVAAPAPASRAQASAPDAAPRAPAAPAPQSGRIDGNQYHTDRDDTLWEVASRVRPSNAVSVHQTMLALQDLNPNAFLDGNINRLRRNQVLRLPTEEQIRSRSQADALAQVQAQNSAWREGRMVQPVAAARQLDATRRSQAGNAPAQAPAEDNLRLVSAAAGKSTSGSDNGAATDSKALADKLAVNQESLATSQRENQELKERLGDLQSQLDKLQRLIELKNEQMAKLQGGLAADAAAPAAAAGSAPAAAAEAPAVAAEPAQPAVENKAEAKPESESKSPASAEGQSQAAAEPAGAAAPVVAQASAEAAPAPAVAESKPAEPAPVAAAPKPAAKPVAPAPVYEPSLVDEVLANPLLLAAGGGALALLAGLGLMINTRRKSQKQAAEAELFTEVGSQPAVAAADTLAVDELLAGERPQLAPAAPLKASDPLGEAEMYSSYGRFTQAAELLRNAINDEPQRADLRLKLMEVCAEMGDRDGFVRQEAELGEIGGAQPQIDQLRARYPQILASAAAIVSGVSVAAAADAFDVDGFAIESEVVEEAAVEQATPQVDEFSLDDLSLDDLELGAPVQAAPLAAAEPAAGLDDGFDLSLDDLEAELERELAANPDAAVEAPLQLDELTLDGLGDDLLGLEAVAIEPELAAAVGETPVEPAELDFDLELAALELPAAEAAPQAAVTPVAEDDFAFDLGDELLAAGAEPAAAAQSDEDLFAELDQLSLDDALLEEEVAPQAAEAVPAPQVAAVEDEFLLDLADLDLGEPMAPAAELSAEPALAADLQGLDELELELQTLGATVDAEQDLDAAFDEFLAQSGVSELAATAAEPAPAAQQAAFEVDELADLPSLDEPEVVAAPALTGNEDFNFLADTDETATKLELARAYIEMGDADGARDILDEVLKEGSASQQQEARAMMGQIA